PPAPTSVSPPVPPWPSDSTLLESKSAPMRFAQPPATRSAATLNEIRPLTTRPRCSRRHQPQSAPQRPLLAHSSLRRATGTGRPPHRRLPRRRQWYFVGPL